jgi:3-oxoacyl-[acyl-carrier-protein] synthase III
VRPARLASLAHELAGSPVDDETLAGDLQTAAQRVSELSKGRLRTFAPDGVGPADLAVPPARSAIAAAGLELHDLDFIIFATNTADYTFPGSACLLQGLLGAPVVGCLDVRAVCSGFVVALDLARRYVASGTFRNVLVAAAEVPSHQNRFDGRMIELTCLTGDAASAAVVTAGAG